MKSNRSNKISASYDNIWELIGRTIKDPVKTKEIMAMVWDYGTLQFEEGKSFADPKGYPDLKARYDECLPVDHNMCDTAHCMANCATPCGRKKPQGPGIYTVSDFTKTCTSFKPKA